MNLSDITPDDLWFIRRRAASVAYSAPWLVDNLVSSVCFELVRRPDLIAEHRFEQAVNMLAKSRFLDLLKRRQTLPVGEFGDEFDPWLPAVVDPDPTQWESLQQQLEQVVPEPCADQVAHVAIMHVRDGLHLAQIAELLGIRKMTAERYWDRAKVAVQRNPLVFA